MFKKESIKGQEDEFEKEYEWKEQQKKVII